MRYITAKMQTMANKESMIGLNNIQGIGSTLLQVSKNISYAADACLI